MNITQSDIVSKLYSTMTTKQILTFEKRELLQTGVKKIDDRFGFPTGFYSIVGSPGTGKGWLALWLSKQFLIHNNKRTVYFSLEMSEGLVRTRILQQWSNLTKDELENGGDVKWALKCLKEDNILVDEYYVDDSKLQTTENFSRWFEKYYELGYRVFHFDHLHEISGANDNRMNPIIMEKWGQLFKNICKSYKDVWLFIYVQPNKSGYEKQILKRQDVTGSKSVIEKCDFFISINREKLEELEEESRDVYLYIDKNRYNDCNHVAFKLRFAETGNFHSFIGDKNE